MRRTIQFTGRIQEVAENAVARRIGATRYRAIKDLEPHPCFIELCVAQEGESTGRVLGKGPVRKRWSRAIVQELAARFKSPSLFSAPDLYDGHDAANARRRAVGKLFEGWEEGGRAFAFGIVTESDAAEALRRGDRDTCSIEAAVEFRADGDVWDVDGILPTEPVAVALADSRLARPGFAGAGVTQVIQELEGEGGGMDLTRVAAWCKANQIRPDQVFAKQDLLNVGLVADAVRDELAVLEKKLTDASAKTAADLQSAQQDLSTARAETASLRRRELRLSDETRRLIESAPATRDKGNLVVPYVREHLPEAIFSEPDPARRQAAIESAAAEIVRQAETIGLNFVPPLSAAPGGGGAPRPLPASRAASGPVTLKTMEDPGVNDLIPRR